MRFKDALTIILCLTSLVALSYAQAANSVLPAPRNGLMPLAFPNTAGFETAVRTHLLASQAALVTATKDATTTDPQLSEAYGKLGQVYHAFALLAAAETCYLNAQKLTPQDYRWIYLAGYLAQQARRDDEALAAYHLVQTLRPDYLAAWVNAGNLYLQQNHLDKAVAAFTAALKRDKRCAAAHYGLGQVALTQRDYASALAHLERALSAAPDANRIHYALAMAQRGLGDLEKARAHLQLQGAVGVRAADPLLDALSDFARGERWHLLRARGALDAKRYAEAAEEFKLALVANPASVPALINLGATLMQLGQTAAALEKYQSALRYEPNNAAAHTNLGFLFVQQQQHTAAVEHLQAALSQQPEDHEARYALAGELFKLQRNDEAMNELTRVIEADPANEEALLEWVKWSYRGQRYQMTLDRLKRSQEQFPQKGQTAATLAFLLATVPQIELRNGDQALALAQKVFQATGAPEHGALVALALAELGRCAEAAAWQRRMVALAESAKQADLANRLSTELPHYEKASACRPQ